MDRTLTFPVSLHNDHVWFCHRRSIQNIWVKWDAFPMQRKLRLSKCIWRDYYSRGWHITNGAKVLDFYSRICWAGLYTLWALTSVSAVQLDKGHRRWGVFRSALSNPSKLTKTTKLPPVPLSYNTRILADCPLENERLQFEPGSHDVYEANTVWKDAARWWFPVLGHAFGTYDCGKTCSVH